MGKKLAKLKAKGLTNLAALSTLYKASSKERTKPIVNTSWHKPSKCLPALSKWDIHFAFLTSVKNNEAYNKPLTDVLAVAIMYEFGEE
jgi:hypothetical protein